MNLEPQSQIQDFRIFLQQDLIARTKKNSKYSLRAYANLLSVNSGTLSRLLSGNRSFTPELIRRISGKLGLDPQTTMQFVETAKKRETKPTLRFDQIAVDQFHIIAEWYHYAILELTRLEGFEPTPQFISRVLNVPIIEVKAAIERLVRLDYLEIKDSNWIDRSGLITTVGQEWTTPALRRFQRQILEKAIQALDETPYEKREQTSLTMAIDSKQIKKAKEMIRKFNADFTDLIESAKKRDHVYHCSVSFYPVTKFKEEKSPK